MQVFLSRPPDSFALSRCGIGYLQEAQNSGYSRSRQAPIVHTNLVRMASVSKCYLSLGQENEPFAISDTSQVLQVEGTETGKV